MRLQLHVFIECTRQWSRVGRSKRGKERGGAGRGDFLFLFWAAALKPPSSPHTRRRERTCRWSKKFIMFLFYDYINCSYIIYELLAGWRLRMKRGLTPIGRYPFPPLKRPRHGKRISLGTNFYVCDFLQSRSFVMPHLLTLDHPQAEVMSGSVCTMPLYKKFPLLLPGYPKTVNCSSKVCVWGVTLKTKNERKSQKLSKKKIGFQKI